MNFLQLCQALRNRAPGIGGMAGQPLSVLNQQGDLMNVVDWTRDAWTEIQAFSPDWLFMRDEFSATVPAGTLQATAADLGVTNLSYWHAPTLRAYRVSEGVAGDQFLVEWDHDLFRDTYRFGQQVPGKPVVWAARPRDKAVQLGPVPDGDCVVYGEYQRSPQILAANTDTPNGLPEEFHMLIVYWAMTKHAGFEAAPEIMADAMNQRETLWGRLTSDWLPRIGFAGSLA